MPYIVVVTSAPFLVDINFHTEIKINNWRAGASQPSLTAGPRCRDIYICDPLWEKVQFRANNEFELCTNIAAQVSSRYIHFLV